VVVEKAELITVFPAEVKPDVVDAIHAPAPATATLATLL
jgi:hypothetical protein